MTYKGRIKDGSIVLDESVELPEGAAVVVEIEATDEHTFGDDGDSRGSGPYRPLSERLPSLFGTPAEYIEMPEDWSENHDKYIREEILGRDRLR